MITLHSHVSREVKDRFIKAIEAVKNRGAGTRGIGTLSERTLHAVIKYFLEPQESNHEVRIGRYVADIVGENGIIEIQTGSFNKIRKKLEAFLSVANVTVVYPIPHNRWIYWVDPVTGEASGRRKSPKTGNIYHALYELYKIKDILTNPRLSVLLLLVDVDDYRTLNGWDKTKKRGSSRCERIPITLAEMTELGGGAGYGALIPGALPDMFTSREYSKAARISLHEAQTALNVLYYVGEVERVGKRGRMYLYERVSDNNTNVP